MLTRKRKREIEYQDSAQRAFRLVRSFQFVSPARRRWNILRTIIKRIHILRYWAGVSSTGISRIWQRLDELLFPHHKNFALKMRPIRGTPPTGRGIARLMPLP